MRFLCAELWRQPIIRSPSDTRALREISFTAVFIRISHVSWGFWNVLTCPFREYPTPLCFQNFEDFETTLSSLPTKQRSVQTYHRYPVYILWITSYPLIMPIPDQMDLRYMLTSHIQSITHIHTLCIIMYIYKSYTQLYLMYLHFLYLYLTYIFFV